MTAWMSKPVKFPASSSEIAMSVSVGCRPRFEMNDSSRSKRSFTGRLSFIARSAVAISCEKGSLFPPKPPPTLGRMTVILCIGRPVTSASARCT
jgi:hypothetical protein